MRKINVSSASKTLILVFLFWAAPLFAQKKHLVVYAYSSFVSAWGPGPKLIENFKKQCDCEVDLTDMGDTNLIIDKLSRIQTSNKVDVIVGLDQLALASAEQKVKWMDLKNLKKKGFVGSDDYKNFVAFDWAPLSFVYRKTDLPTPPATLDDLLASHLKNQILLEDPRLSTPGLQFLTWVYLTKKEKTKDFLLKLKDQVHSVSPSWSTAYGLFKKEQAKLVFSYLSSPIYHWKEEKNENIVSAAFTGTHAIQTEWVGVPQSCVNCELSSRFVAHLLSDESQKLLMDFNYMYPVNTALIKGSLYEKLPVVKTIELTEYKKIKVKELLKIWKDIFK